MIWGNQAATELIDRAVNHDRLSHAYLFYGEKGLGKKTIAAYFAKAILCKGQVRPCGSCGSCKKMDAQTHPDFVHLSGAAKKNELTVANIRSLKADASVYPNDGDRKVFLISDCQKMQAPAANALLKLLEEPPEHLVILLTVDDRKHVLPTILSRCIPIGVFPVEKTECSQALQMIARADQGRADAVAEACGGNIGRGIEMIAPLEENDYADEFCSALAARREYEMLKILHRVSGDKKEYQDFLEELSIRFRDSLVRKAGADVSGGKAAADLASRFSQRQLLESIGFLSRALRNLEMNANVSLLSAWLTGVLTGADGKDIKGDYYD